MTFKNIKNLFHTKKRIKRIKRKDSNKCLIGGGGDDPLVYYIDSNITSSHIAYADIKMHTSTTIRKSIIENAEKVFQDFIDIEQARSNLAVINYNDEAIPARSFVLSIFKYSEDDPFRYGTICVVKFKDVNDYVFTLSKDRTNLQNFRDQLRERYNEDFAIIAHAAANNNSHLQFTTTL